MRRFVELAGGAGRARIAVVPMASEEAVESGAETASELDSLGAQTFVFLVDRTQADEPEFVRRLDSATGIWFCGGDQARLTDVFGGTASLRAVHARFQAGAVSAHFGRRRHQSDSISPATRPRRATQRGTRRRVPSIERAARVVPARLSHGAIVDSTSSARAHNR